MALEARPFFLDRRRIELSGFVSRRRAGFAIMIEQRRRSFFTRRPVCPRYFTFSLQNVVVAIALTLTITLVRAQGSDTIWRSLKIGAGGFVTGIDIASDGTKVIRTDTYGAYWWNASAPNPGHAGGSGMWQQIVNVDSMKPSEYSMAMAETANGPGVFEIRIAPSNTSRFYMCFNGKLYRSDNKGSTWNATGLLPVKESANDTTKGFGPYIAVDPANADVVYASTPSSGLFVSTNAGASFQRVVTVGNASMPSGAGQGGGHLIGFDSASGLVERRTQGIYVSTYGSGVYHSADGGSTWVLTSGSPITHHHMVVANDGCVWLVDDSGSNHGLWIYRGGTWKNSTEVNGGQWWSVAVDPANSARAVLSGAGGEIDITTDHGSTWSGINYNGRRVATDIPWLAWTKEIFMTNGNTVFDPSDSNKLYFAEGIGVWYSSPPESLRTTFNWNSQSAGIEQLVANGITSPWGASSKPLVYGWDRPVFRVDNPGVYPASHGPNRDDAIKMGWSADWSPSSPLNVVIQTGDTQSSASADGGLTWRPFPSVPGTIINGSGGTICVSTPTNWLWQQSNNGSPYYTTDGGLTWNTANIAGIPSHPKETGWGFVHFVDAQAAAADRVNDGVFYMYNYGPSGARQAEGFYRTTDGGVSWSHISSGQTRVLPGGIVRLKSVPNNAGHLFFSGGLPAGSQGPWPHMQRFYRSMDGGTTWRDVSSGRYIIREVWDFGFGKAAPGQAYPTIYLYGWVNGIGGFWRSVDNASTWTQIGGLFPIGWFDQLKAVEGDANIYGRVYAGFSGSGWIYGDLQ